MRPVALFTVTSERISERSAKPFDTVGTSNWSTKGSHIEGLRDQGSKVQTWPDPFAVLWIAKDIILRLSTVTFTEFGMLGSRLS